MACSRRGAQSTRLPRPACLPRRPSTCALRRRRLCPPLLARCAACKSLYPKVMKLVAARPDVLLLAVNYDDNKTLVKALGVKVR